MERKRKLTAILCAVVLFCSAVLPALGSSTIPTIYLLAVNDKMADLPGGARPVSVDGVIYVPYTTFDKNVTGVDLGVYYGIDRGQGTILTLYSMDGMLVFRVTMGVCEDGQGNRMSFRAVYRGPNNNIPYVPAAAVCNFFGLKYSYMPTADRGTLVRISNSSVSMSDQFFLSSATGAMSYRYNNILRSLTPQTTSTPVPSAVPVPTAAPTPTASAQPTKEAISVYLAVNASESESELWNLFPTGVRALFLFTPESLPAQRDKVRKLLAAGHSIGLLVGGNYEQALEQLERGNELLTHIARTRTRIVAAPEELTDALAAEGWACWQTSVSTRSESALLADLDRERSTGYVELPAESGGLSRVLTHIRSEGYTLRQPLETELMGG